MGAFTKCESTVPRCQAASSDSTADTWLLTVPETGYVSLGIYGSLDKATEIMLSAYSTES